MRALRGISSPSKISAALQFSRTKKVFTEITDVVRGSNIQCRGKSFATTVPSDLSKSQSTHKRISKDERRAMVESLVDKYKALNAGKYPSPSAVQKEVGGSYYIIRQILQELEYKSKISPTSERDSTLLEKQRIPNEECQLSPEIEEVSSSERTMDLTSNEPSLGIKDDSHLPINNSMERDKAITNNFEGPQLSTFEEAGNTTGESSNSIGTHGHQKVLHPHHHDIHGGEKKEATSEGSLDINGGKGEIGQAAGQEAPGSDHKLGRDSSRKDNEDDQLPGKSTVWGNLRSFADDVMNFWRKM